VQGDSAEVLAVLGVVERERRGTHWMSTKTALKSKQVWSGMWAKTRRGQR
jgi:hypothetical protein